MPAQSKAVILLDTKITPSFACKVHQAAVCVVLILVLFGAKLMLWQNIVVLLLFLCLLYTAMQKMRLKHIVLKPDRMADVLIGQTKDMFCQANIAKIQDYGLYVVLDLDVIEPFKHPLRFCIFYDALDKKDYQRLKMLARFYPNKQTNRQLLY